MQVKIFLLLNKALKNDGNKLCVKDKINTN